MRLGLSLSGGGFRATLFHLGVVRLLQEVGLLEDVTHICSVSGGSILAAHLVQNWNHYIDDKDFDKVAKEIVGFVRGDVRGRIARRFLPWFPVYCFLKLLSLSEVLDFMPRFSSLADRLKFLQIYLLQRYYSNELYTSRERKRRGTLSELAGVMASKPRLYMLAANLTTGGLCSFTNDGFSIDAAPRGKSQRPKLLRTDLTPIALAVAASSAFPAFFPPVKMTRKGFPGSDDFNPPVQRLADGGVYDNLGIRKFQQLIGCKLGRALLSAEDIVDAPSLRAKLVEGGALGTPCPAKAVWEALGPAAEQIKGLDLEDSKSAGDFLDRLNSVLTRRDFFDVDHWKGVQLPPEAAEALERGDDQLQDEVERLNRLLIEAAFPEEIRMNHGGFDAILVSNAQLAFDQEIEPGFIFGTALRATDILMYRINQLEIERAEHAGVIGGEGRSINKFTFVYIDTVIERDEVNRTPLGVDLQKLLPRVRTDLDEFSLGEISALLRHGYCVARKAVKDAKLCPADRIPLSEPWDPTGRPQPTPGQELDVANELKDSSRRKYRLLALRDWFTYVLLALAILMCSVPLAGWYIGGWTVAHVKYAVLDFVDPPKEPWDPPKAEPVENLPNVDYKGLQIVEEERTVDLRRWKKVKPDQKQRRVEAAIVTRKLTLSKQPTVKEIRFPFYTTGYAVDPRPVDPVKHPYHVEKGGKAAVIGPRETKRWDLVVDVANEEDGKEFHLTLEAIYWNGSQNLTEWAGIRIDVPMKNASLRILFPRNKTFSRYQLSRFPVEKRKVSEDRRKRSRV